MGTIVPFSPEHAEKAGQIVYEAFKDIADRHNFEPAFESPEFATLVVRLLGQTEGWNSYIYLEDGAPAAVNFGDERDEVVGVGPVATGVAHQGKGLGRKVMQAMLDSAERNGFRSVRLNQVAYNMISFSLYAAMGFDVKDGIALFAGAPKPDDEIQDAVRDYRPDDLDALDRLCRDVLGYSRRNDIERMAVFAPPAIVERAGKVAGYALRFPGDTAIVGHAAAVDFAAMRDLIVGTTRATGGKLQFLVPYAQGDLIRWCLAGRFRLKELQNYMVLGDYEAPSGYWMPSAFY